MDRYQEGMEAQKEVTKYWSETTTEFKILHQCPKNLE